MKRIKVLALAIALSGAAGIFYTAKSNTQTNAPPTTIEKGCPHCNCDGSCCAGGSCCASQHKK